MDIDLNLEADARQDRYWDLLVLYLLVGSTLGDCELYRRIGHALDAGDDRRVSAELAHFEALPDELKAQVRDGDPTLEALNDLRAAAEPVPLTVRRPESA